MGRRIEIIFVFFLVWGCALIAEMANFSFLGYERGVGSQGLAFGFALMLGFSWQVIFQGPSRFEIMEGLRRRHGKNACTIDRVYLQFNINRTIRVITVLILWSSLWFIPLLRTGETWFLSGTTVFFAIIVALRVLIIRLRVLSGRFGTTQHEARELLKFLSKLHASSDGRFDPPGRMKPLPPHVEHLTIPSRAEVAL